MKPVPPKIRSVPGFDLAKTLGKAALADARAVSLSAVRRVVMGLILNAPLSVATCGAWPPVAGLTPVGAQPEKDSQWGSTSQLPLREEP
jgi:hypothetical protein